MLMNRSSIYRIKKIPIYIKYIFKNEYNIIKNILKKQYN